MAGSPIPAEWFEDWSDESRVPEELVGRLQRASEKSVLELIATFSPQQRAWLAVFCYRRAHFHDLGLTIAASCEQSTLIQVLGTAMGTVLHAQSRERPPDAPRAFGHARSKITLARPAFARPRSDFDQDEADGEVVRMPIPA